MLGLFLKLGTFNLLPIPDKQLDPEIDVSDWDLILLDES